MGCPVTTVGGVNGRWERIWVVLTVGYAFVRIALADRFFSEYGLSVWWFAAVELSSSALFGVSSARFVKSVVTVTGTHRIPWAFATLVGFTAPDAFVFWSTRRLPHSLLAAFAGFVGVSVITSVISVRRRISKGKSLPPGSSPSSASGAKSTHVVSSTSD
jgi:hypothetical protein